MTFFLSLLTTVQTWGQIGGESTTEELVSIGFENVRWTENDKERIYTIENNVFLPINVSNNKPIIKLPAIIEIALKPYSSKNLFIY